MMTGVLEEGSSGGEIGNRSQIQVEREASDRRESHGGYRQLLQEA